MSCPWPTAADGSFLAARGGRYKPVSLLGRGSFGTCVLVRISPEPSPSSAGALRVVKTVDLLRASDEDTASRRSEALREAEVLKSLHHPNIIGYDDAFLAESHLCIVMEYADGGDLSVAIQRRREATRRYHEREAMGIFAQIALALRHVHELRILHRDVKSQNVFLTSGGVVKLGDFGVSKVLAASEVCAATRIGTPQCVAPEVCENHTYDFKADVWGLGVILYQLLALECPFNGGSFAALAVRICTAEPRPVSSVYSPETRMLLSRLLAKRAEERPSSAEIVAMPHVRRSVSALPIARRGSSRSSWGGSHGHLSDASDVEASPRTPSCAERPPTSPQRVLRRRNANALRRCSTVPECGSPEVARRKGPSMAKKSMATSPLKAKGSSPRKRRSPKKSAARMLPVPELLGNCSSPCSRPTSVTDLLKFFLDSPVFGAAASTSEEAAKSSRSHGSDGADTTSTRAATVDGGSARSAPGETAQAIGRAYNEDINTCTALLSELELEFGL